MLLECDGLADVVPADVVSRTRTAARANATARPGRYPLVVLSPGFTLHRYTLTNLSTELASRGYIVAAVDHAYESHGTEFPGGGRVLTCVACEVLQRTPDWRVAQRARACLVTDHDVCATAARYAAQRPELDAPSAAAAASVADVIESEIVGETTDPELMLWQALLDAPDNGISVPDLMKHTGMRRTWIYDRLHAHATAGRAQQTSRGRWRATDPYRTTPAG